MFAIIRTGGKQYKVQPDQVITIERLPANVGDVLSIETVLMVGDAAKTQVGKPFIQGAVVKGIVIDQDRSEKIIVFKKRRRHNYRRKQGHRQNQTILGIVEISAPNGIKVEGKRDFNAKIEKKATEPRNLTKKEALPKDSKKTVKSSPKKTSDTPKKSVKETSSNPAVSKNSATPAAKSAPKKAPSKSK